MMSIEKQTLVTLRELYSTAYKFSPSKVGHRRAIVDGLRIPMAARGVDMAIVMNFAGENIGGAGPSLVVSLMYS